MTRTATGAPTGCSLRLTLLGAPQLLVEAIGRLARENQIDVSVGTTAEPASLVVLVEPGAAHWQAVEPIGAPVVVLTSAPVESKALLDLIARGAEGVLPIECSTAELFDVIRSVAAGGSGLTGAQVRMLTSGVRALVRADETADVELTAREREILVAIDQGLSVKQAARVLSISPKTVENTRRMLYRKLAAKNRSQAIARAYELRLLTDPSDA